jgi:hypothetical protein
VANFGLALYPDRVKNGALKTGFTGWYWQSYCMTQYASNPSDGGIANFVRCHTTVVHLLDRAKAMGILESVKDESHFWESRDLTALVETVAKSNRHVAAIVGRAKDAEGQIPAPITKFPNFEHLEADGRLEEDGDLDS